ncbi:hypothetical protein [Candidatus Vidania fulgoroideorum]
MIFKFSFYNKAGRLLSKIAKIISKNNKVYLKINKKFILNNKIYYKHSGFPSGLKKYNTNFFLKKNGIEILFNKILIGMLKNKKNIKNIKYVRI